jgi:hypothetical protein
MNKFRSKVVGPGIEDWRDVIITNAQTKLLFTTPITIIPAPRTGTINLFQGARIHKPAGTAFTIGAAGVLQISYTNAAGLALAQAAVVGFADQATAQTRWIKPYHAASGDSAIVPVAAAAIVFHQLTANMADGTSVFNIRVFYKNVPTVPAA